MRHWQVVTVDSWDALDQKNRRRRALDALAAFIE